jgi:hypothetical protein
MEPPRKKIKADQGPIIASSTSANDVGAVTVLSKQLKALIQDFIMYEQFVIEFEARLANARSWHYTCSFHSQILRILDGGLEAALEELEKLRETVSYFVIR